MKRLLTFILFICISTFGLSKSTNAGNGYSPSPFSTATNLSNGVTTVTGATNGNCLYNNSGTLGNKSCVTLISRASAYLSGSNQSFTSGVATIIAFNALVPGFSSTSEFDIVSNKGRFTSTNGGVYQVNAAVLINFTPASNAADFISIYINGVDALDGPQFSFNLKTTTLANDSVNATIHLNPTDYMDIRIVSNETSPFIYAIQASSWVQIVQIQ